MVKLTTWSLKPLVCGMYVLSGLTSDESDSAKSRVMLTNLFLKVLIFLKIPF